MIYYESNYLMHYGTPGMKWGHRKQRIRKGRVSRRQMRAEYRAKNAARVKAWSNSKKGKATARTNRRRNYGSTAIGLGAGVVGASAAAVFANRHMKDPIDKIATIGVVGGGSAVVGKILSRKAMRNK